MEVIRAWGHENITAKHKTTLEFTKDREITKRGDCIVAVRANKGLRDLSKEFKEKARSSKAVIKCVIRCGELTEIIMGRGHEKLTFEHESDIVIRKSDFICPRTLMIKADKAAKDLSRSLINLLKDKNQEVIIEICVIKQGPGSAAGRAGDS
ncbi:MAG: DUF371 domain-containing protein [Candidatus Hydrothermarchaeota archaeon]|nr:MAG: DUF371 domain-containing protein [Candidatus Hydrothermarchaeota archaeon]